MAAVVTAPTGIKSSMGRNTLQVRQGDRNTLPYYNGVLAAAALASPVSASVRAGAVVSLTTGLRLVPGIVATAGATGGPVPFYAWSGLDLNNLPDVYRTKGMPSASDKPASGTFLGGGIGGNPFYGIPAVSDAQVGSFATIQHVAAVELATTAFDNSDTAIAGYTVGAPLTAIGAAATGASVGDATYLKDQLRGLLRPVALATDVIVGYVAPAGVYRSPMGYLTLAFTPAYVAGTTVVLDVLGTQNEALSV